MDNKIRVSEQSAFYFNFETLTGRRKESKWYGVSIPGEICASIIYHAEFNRVFCSDIAEYMIRDVLWHDYKPEIISSKDEDYGVYFHFSKELASILEVFRITTGILEMDLIRSYLIFWEEHLRGNYDKL